MPELDQAIETLRRMRAKPEAADRDWYRVNAAVTSRKAEVQIYDDIGWMGTSAKSLAGELKALDVDEIELRLNSPGGDAWDGIAIYNALRDHPATVNVVVDGLAASAASIVAMAGTTVRMNRGAQMMVHDAWGLVIGNAGDLTEAAAMFDKLSDGMAEIYAARAGGTVADWREAMAAESWYSAAEAVDAGLADELVEQDTPVANARWSMAAFAFAHAGRQDAPAPRIPARPAAPADTPISAAEAARRIHAASTHNSPKEASVDAAKIREALGLAADAPDNEVKAAFEAAGLAPTPPEPTGGPAPEPAASATGAPGTVVLSASVWEETQKTIAKLSAHVDKTKRDERDQVIASAVEAGKFTPAQTQHFAKLWDADPDGTRNLIESLTPNSALAVAAAGYAGSGDKEFDAEYAGLFPPSETGGRRG
jgi:ATP-dependent protease ClpP protease subunit